MQRLDLLLTSPCDVDFQLGPTEILSIGFIAALIAILFTGKIYIFQYKSCGFMRPIMTRHPKDTKEPVSTGSCFQCQSIFRLS